PVMDNFNGGDGRRRAGTGASSRICAGMGPMQERFLSERRWRGAGGGPRRWDGSGAGAVVGLEEEDEALDADAAIAAEARGRPGGREAAACVPVQALRAAGGVKLEKVQEIEDV